MAEEPLKRELIEIYCSDTLSKEDKTKRVVAIYEELNVKEIARKTMEEYNKEALSALKEIKADEKAKGVLEEFANKLMNRNK